MTKNRHDIHTKSTKRTDKQADRVLLCGVVTEKKEKAHPSHFLKFLLASRTNGTFGFAQYTPVLSLPKEANASQNQKSRFFANALPKSRI